MRPVITLAAAAAVLVSACSATPRDKAAPAPATTTPPTVTTAAPAPAPAPKPMRSQNWTALQIGDCLAAPPSTDPAVVTVDLVDCAVPHQAEVFVRANIPVDTALSDNANAQCATGLTQYTGSSAVGGGYTVTYLIDSDQDRTSNNPLPSTLICLLQSAQGQPLTGSAKR